ncbi:hypothetical protein MP228_004999 [Amoeboaphelidium protococcarum]|nr:hypothetical protein MP228_009794 [Amoeboaphelidium protococcarum]KAI3650145.1 hypothetical protein MP228_004999 [Amoeboaphelidium protococcarum]
MISVYGVIMFICFIIPWQSSQRAASSATSQQVLSKHNLDQESFPIAQKQEDDLWTTYRCKNKKLVLYSPDENKEASACHFKNLCLRNGQFIAAFRPEKELRPPYLFQTDAEYQSQGQNDWPFRMQDNADGHYGFTRRVYLEENHHQNEVSVHQIDGPISKNDGSVIMYDDLAVVTSLYAAGNAGHMLWEAFAPGFGASEFLSATSASQKRRILFSQSCRDNDRDVLYDYPVDNCLYFTASYVGLVSDQHPMVVTEMQDGKTHCFKDVVIPNQWFNRFVYDDPIATTQSHMQMRNYMYSRLGIKPQRRLRGQSLKFLVQLKKSGRHGRMFANSSEILSVIQSVINRHRILVDIQLQTLDLSSTSIQDQVRALSNADIYFTNGGSGLYLSNMLRDGTVVIAPTQCDVRRDMNEEKRYILKKLASTNPQWYHKFDQPDDTFIECTTYEVDMINSLGYINLLPLPVRPGDVLLDSNFHLRHQMVREYVSRAIHLMYDGR